MQELINGKTRTTENIARGNENRNAESDPRGMGPFTGSCGRLGAEVKISIDRAISQIEHQSACVAIADQVIGGILRHLIDQARDQQVRLKDQVQELDSQIAEWEKLLGSLQTALTEEEDQQ